MSVSLHEVLQNDGELDWKNNVEDAKWVLARKHEFEEIIAEAEETIEKEERKKMSRTLELTNKGQIKDGDKVLWVITVFNADNENDPFLLFNFDKAYNYPTKEIVKKLMSEQYVDWVNWVDKYGYSAETVYVD